MHDFLKRLFSEDGFMPHGHCYLWQPEIVWLHVGSDALVALSYTSIPFTLAYFVFKRRDLPFTWMFRLFGTFIIACAATHYMAIYTLWFPAYRLSGSIKLITALASVPTAYLLIRLVPQALSIPSPSDLRRVNEELANAHAELEATNAQLEASNAELEAFSYSVAHDLRAPLRAVHGFANILLSDANEKLDARGRDCISEITQNADHMAELIDGLLLLSRVTRSELSRESVDMSALSRRVLGRLADDTPGRQVKTTVQPGMLATADPRLARAVLENLLENAWKFTRRTEQARIDVGASEVDGEMVFHVRDNGAGFDAEYAQRMFTAFQRFHRQSDYKGTGIGLATVRRIVHRHGGRVWAEGAVGAGASFYFTFGHAEPVSREAAA